MAASVTSRDREVALATAALFQVDPDLRRDWYGHELSIAKLEQFAGYVLDRLVQPVQPMDVVDQVALGMLTYEVPMIAESIEEMASDEHIETLVEIVLEAVITERAST